MPRDIPDYNLQAGISLELQDFDDIEKTFLREKAGGLIQSMDSIEKIYSSPGVSIFRKKYLDTFNFKFVSIFNPSSCSTIHLSMSGDHIPGDSYLNINIAQKSGEVAYYKKGVIARKMAHVGDIVFDENTLQVGYLPNVHPVKVYNWLGRPTQAFTNAIGISYTRRCSQVYKNRVVVVLCQIGNVRTLTIRNKTKVYSIRRGINSELSSIPSTVKKNISLFPAIFGGEYSHPMIPGDASPEPVGLFLNPNGKHVFSLKPSRGGARNLKYCGLFENGFPHGAGILYKLEGSDDKSLTFFIYNKGSVKTVNVLSEEHIDDFISIVPEEEKECRTWMKSIDYYDQAFSKISEAQLATFTNYAVFKTWCSQKAEPKKQAERQQFQEARKKSDEKKAASTSTPSTLSNYTPSLFQSPVAADKKRTLTPPEKIARNEKTGVYIEGSVGCLSLCLYRDGECQKNQFLPPHMSTERDRHDYQKKIDSLPVGDYNAASGFYSKESSEIREIKVASERFAQKQQEKITNAAIFRQCQIERAEKELKKLKKKRKELTC